MEEFGQLVPVGGGDPIPLLKPHLLIGRRGGCDIALNFPNVSSRHCELQIENGYWKIRDVGSTNGIKVNGTRCDEKFVLPGEEVTIAKHRYTLEYTADPTAEVPIEDENVFAKSLMEKAGLSRRKPARKTTSQREAEREPAERPRPAPESRPSQSQGGAISDDDAALDFLND